MICAPSRTRPCSIDAASRTERSSPLSNAASAGFVTSLPRPCACGARASGGGTAFIAAVCSFEALARPCRGAAWLMALFERAEFARSALRGWRRAWRSSGTKSSQALRAVAGRSGARCGEIESRAGRRRSSSSFRAWTLVDRPVRASRGSAVAPSTALLAECRPVERGSRPSGKARLALLDLVQRRQAM
jgi:hypothetical protein